MSVLTLIMSAVDECVDCCSKNAVASSEVILAEVFVVLKFMLMSSVGVVCRLLLCTGCQRAVESGMTSKKEYLIFERLYSEKD